MFLSILLFDKLLLSISTSLQGPNTSHLSEIFFQFQSNTHTFHKNFYSFDAYLSSTHEKLWLCYPYRITQPESIGRGGGKEMPALVSYDSVVGYSSLIWWFPSHAESEHFYSLTHEHWIVFFLHKSNRVATTKLKLTQEADGMLSERLRLTSRKILCTSIKFDGK